MGYSVLNRKLIYLGCNQKSWSSSNAVQYCWNNLKGKNAPITQIKTKKKNNNKYLQITYKVRGCHELYILLATPYSPMSLLLCQKMSEIHCGGEGSTITNIPQITWPSCKILTMPKVWTKFFFQHPWHTTRAFVSHEIENDFQTKILCPNSIQRQKAWPSHQQVFDLPICGTEPFFTNIMQFTSCRLGLSAKQYGSAQSRKIFSCVGILSFFSCWKHSCYCFWCCSHGNNWNGFWAMRYWHFTMP